MHSELNNFLSDIEKKAFTMARLATRDSDPALDIVQDTMLVLTHKYADKNPQEWTALFYRILQNKITDWHRRQTLRNRLFSWFGFFEEQEEVYNATETYNHYPQNHACTPDKVMQNTEVNKQTMLAIAQLPLRQQQAFLLRQWQGFSVSETAGAMSISEGSVKTHYSRAIATLKIRLKEIYYETA